MKNEVKRTERGWAGHFICSDRCKFRRNTLLEYEGTAIVVSTVGLFIRDSDGEVDEVGLGRDYETMAFYVDPESGDYKDADVTRQIYFNSQWALKITKKDKYADLLANDMHEAVVEEITEDLLKGLRKEIA